LEFAELANDAGIPSSVLTVLTGTGEALGNALVANVAVKKVDVTVSMESHRVCCLIVQQAGTNTGRAIGGLAGSNLASYTAELGGKVCLFVFSSSISHGPCYPRHLF
jgi:acyl-CoA reductase-like NAD-dependent aldehyde dehydrogenase